MTEDEVIAQANASGFPNLKVACPEHGLMRDKDKGWRECGDPRCHPFLEERKRQVRLASASPVTEAMKAAWKAARVTGGTGYMKPEKA